MRLKRLISCILPILLLSSCITTTPPDESESSVPPRDESTSSSSQSSESSSSSSQSSESGGADSSSSTHTHTYSDSWSSDPTYHWHESTCGHDDAVEKEKHSFEKKSTVEATYESGGYTIYECSVCHYFYNGDETSKLEHHYSDEWTEGENTHWHACTDKGFEDSKKDEASHTYDDEVVDPTYESGGYTIRRCEICGHESKNEIPKLEHKYSSDWSMDPTGHWHACTDEGYESLLTKDKAEHKLVDNADGGQTCSTCGYAVLDCAKYLTFTKNEGEESYSVSCRVDSLKGNLIIPSTYEGLPVTAIGDRAFYLHRSLISVVIPDSVTSIGDSAFFGCNSLTFVTIPKSLTRIDDNAFCLCLSLASPVKIPSGVTTIGDGAFNNCESLTTIEIPDSVTYIGDNAFSYCFSVTSPIKIPSNVITIGEYAFCSCPSLSSPVEIPASVTSIGEGAFAYCENIASIIVDEGNEIYDSRDGCNAIIEKKSNTLIAGCNNTVIPPDVVSIATYAIVGCPSISSIRIPASVTSIATSAIMRCPSLSFIGVDDGNQKYDSRNDCNAIIEKESNTLITGCKDTLIPDDVVSIGDYAFADCTELVSIEIPSSVTSIGECAFLNCLALTDVEIPAKVTSISDYVFCLCSSLKSVKMPSGITSIGNQAFGYCFALSSIEIPNGVISIGYLAFQECSSLESISIPPSVESIGDYVFSSCPSLSSIKVAYGNMTYDSRDNCNAIIEKATNTLIVGCKNTVIPSSVTSIGDYAFYGCSSLTSITIPSSVTRIGGGAFQDCSSLLSIEIPKSVTTISYYAFYGCSSLSSVLIPSSGSVTTIDSAAFDNCVNLSKVYYAGTPEQWNLQVLYDDDSGLATATKYYFTTNGEKETAPGNWWYYDDDMNIKEITNAATPDE